MAAALAADCVLLATISRRAPIFGMAAPFGIVAFAVFLGLGYSRLKELDDELPFRRVWFALHFLLVFAIWLAYFLVPRGPKYRPYAPAAHIVAGAGLLTAVALATLACVPLSKWAKVIRSTGRLWMVALTAGLAASCLRYPLQLLWGFRSGRGGLLQGTAFRSVYAVLHLFLPDVVVDPATFVVGTQRFSVMIEEQCSGLEGLGLVLVFTLVWLWYFRKESRFPQALLLVPLALGFVWVLNIARICAVILIGNAGAPEIAMVGFHSQAGWIAFTTVALTFSMATRKVAWVQSTPAHPPGAASGELPGTASGQPVEGRAERAESPATAAFLVPFLAILAASFVSKSVSGYFEWLYPLRFVAAAVALWHYRSEYARLNWRFDWRAPLAGLGIFLLWIAPTWWTKGQAAGPLGPALAALAPGARLTWIAFRIAAATVTVPVAEELAFRGYLARRLLQRNFESVAFTGLTFVSIALSSLVFGVMHGAHWSSGILAGVVFALLLKRKGRIGDAVATHATSNLLLAAWVLLRGDWAQW